MSAWLAYLTVAIVWGSTYLAIAQAMDAFTPLGVAPARFLSAGILCLLIGRLRREAPLLRSDFKHLAICGLLMLTCANGLVCWGETRISSGMAAVLCAMMPLFLVILERRPLAPLGMLGLGVGVAGVAVLTEPWSGSHDPLGVIAVLLANVFWAAGTLHARKHIKGSSNAGQAGVQMLWAGAFGLVMAPFTGGFTHSPLTATAIWATAYLVVFGSVLAFSAHAYLIRVWAPSKAGTYAFINPVVAVALGATIRDETLSPQLGLGTALCLMGVALVQFYGRSRSS